MKNFFKKLTSQSAVFSFALLNPKGWVALQERNLMVVILVLMLIAVVPAYCMLFIFGRKYRAGNRATTKSVQDTQKTKFIFLFWIVPACVVFMIAITIWKSTHVLDPYKTIPSTNPPITIEVVALQWKWLFIYPEQHIATINFIQVPVNTPIHFEFTADAPMNSFWIPQLGGQMYAMTGMSSQLNLMANSIGDFAGSAAEVNGQGFSGMKFVVRSSSQDDFNHWIETVKQGTSTLNQEEYNALAKPSENNSPTYYASIDENIYNNVIAKYMPTMEDLGSMNMNTMNNH
jgi:cytochrome o ubiquinol oxidase subunit 2